MDTSATVSGGSSFTDVNAGERPQGSPKEKEDVSPGAGLFDGDTDVDLYNGAGINSDNNNGRNMTNITEDVPARDAEAGKTNGSQKRMTLTFKDVTVRVMASGAMLGETLFSRVDPRVIFAGKGGEQRVSRQRTREDDINQSS